MSANTPGNTWSGTSYMTHNMQNWFGLFACDQLLTGQSYGTMLIVQRQRIVFVKAAREESKMHKIQKDRNTKI